MDARAGDPGEAGFREAQNADYEPEPVIRDQDDLPVDGGQDERLLPDDDRPVSLDPDDTGPA
ncbi:UDP-N-acetylglucosamine pyrophosphorylase [Leifsonia xyli subsp. cynodontis DSM 46306]|uniref:Uncharacterized protein n=1 Tax=Leifsonia xyli subsp. cynodontis DSM 46306 TaxID=1389489 RepID=U3PBU4_LEIXC|nr:hypothetical protein [Leifsonia xyli]AGW40958.1 UDP-N-acetylglucosamine pyrophosphorylase [Leifsonia xyli subsp. cynodontis DSM 46306]